MIGAEAIQRGHSSTDTSLISQGEDRDRTIIVAC